MIVYPPIDNQALFNQSSFVVFLAGPIQGAADWQQEAGLAHLNGCTACHNLIERERHTNPFLRLAQQEQEKDILKQEKRAAEIVAKWLTAPIIAGTEARLINGWAHFIPNLRFEEAKGWFKHYFDDEINNVNQWVGWLVREILWEEV